MGILNGELSVLDDDLVVTLRNEGPWPIELPVQPIGGIRAFTEAGWRRSCHINPKASEALELGPAVTMEIAVPWLRWLAVERRPPEALLVQLAITTNEGTVFVGPLQVPPVEAMSAGDPPQA